MIQKCPECGQWCEVEKQGMLGRATRGFSKAAEGVGNVGASIGRKLFGKMGEKAGQTLGQIASGATYFAPLNAVSETMFGDDYQFVCPTCGHEWSTDDPDDDQSEEYNKWLEELELKDNIRELVDSSSSLINSSKEEKDNHIKELQSYLSDGSLEGISESETYKGILYDALAYSQLVFNQNTNDALSSIKQSLKLYPDDPVSLAIQGMIYGVANKPLADYSAMKSLIRYKDKNIENSYTHFTISQYHERFDQLTNSYINGFLDIPANSRRFLVIDDQFNYLPDSFVVLPYDMIPRDILFPSGHPRSQELYVVHPYKPNEYIPYNDYQLSLFRDELKEFSWIMECLGAKSISFHETQMEETNVTKDYSAKTGGNAEYAGYGAGGSYDRGNSSSEYLKMTSELMEAKEYRITKDTLPYIPQDVVWYQHRPDWHRNCESRVAGRLSKALFKLSTSSITATSNQERKKIEADLKILLFKANGSHEQEENIQLRSEENHTWSVDVEFYPLDDYNIKKKEVLIEQPSTLVAQQSNTLQEKKKNNYLIISLVAVIIVLIGIILAIVL